MGNTMLESVAVYRVKVVDRATGAERYVNAEAASPDQAVAQVAAFGEMVGGAELVEVKRDAPASINVPARTPAAPAIKSAPTCSVCGGSMTRQIDKELWTGGVVLAIGVGVLTLFIPFLGFVIAMAIGVGVERAMGQQPGSSPIAVIVGIVGGCAGLLLWGVLVSAVAHRRRRVLRCTRCSHSVAA